MLAIERRQTPQKILLRLDTNQCPARDSHETESKELMIAPALEQQVSRPETQEPVPQEAMARPRVLMVGPHRTKTLGGISTLIDEILNSSLAAQFDFREIASHTDEYGKFGKFWLAVRALLQFAMTLLRWQPDVVYIHVGGNASMYRKIPFITLARLAGCPVISHFHAGDFEPFFARQSRFGRWLIVRGIGQSTRLITVSKQLGQLLNRLLPKAKVAVVPNGVETAIFTNTSETRHADSFVRVLFAGTMGRLKGERDLIEALKRVPNVSSRVRLVMLGRCTETIEAFCRESGLWPIIDHFGSVPLNERAIFFKWADLFVLPTYAEGMPMVVLEAMAAGLPIITTSVGGIPELIEDGVEGLLIQPGDVGALADRITQLVEDKLERQRMGARGQAKACEFDLSLILERLGGELRVVLPASNLRPLSAKLTHYPHATSTATAQVKRATKE